VRGTEQFRLAGAEGKLLRLPADDGAGYAKLFVELGTGSLPFGVALIVLLAAI
jgi:hypothetical protein